MNWLNILIVVVSLFSLIINWIMLEKKPNNGWFGVLMTISAFALLISSMVSFVRPICYTVDTYKPSFVTKTSDFITIATYNGNIISDNTAKIYNASESNLVYSIYRYKNAWGITLDDKKVIEVR